MIRNILTYSENKEILTSKSTEVTNIEEIKDLVQDMKDTLHNTETGVGISAIQIGVPKRVCIVHHNNRDLVLINPVITRTRGEVSSHEGCLSAPDKFGTFKRAEKVWCKYIDENGNTKELSEGGYISRIIQHELDHFDGWCEVFSLIEPKIIE